VKIQNKLSTIFFLILYAVDIPHNSYAFRGLTPNETELSFSSEFRHFAFPAGVYTFLLHITQTLVHQKNAFTTWPSIITTSTPIFPTWPSIFPTWTSNITTKNRAGAKERP